MDWKGINSLETSYSVDSYISPNHPILVNNMDSILHTPSLIYTMLSKVYTTHDNNTTLDKTCMSQNLPSYKLICMYHTLVILACSFITF